jgi:PPM family protein phosphatase
MVTRITLVSFAKLRYAALTDVGIKRSHNQDACAVQPAAEESVWRTIGHVFIVADGMGGHAVGEKASAKAVRDIPLTYIKHVAQEGAIAAIRRAFTEANADIFDIGQKNPEFRGLGTTGTAIFIRPEGAWIGHVGDSRAYRIRPGKVDQLTFDHSWVWEIARRQGVDPDQLGDFKKNVIVRSLGPDETVEVDIEGPHPMLPGDSFVLCSDGLSNEVKPEEIGAVVSCMPPEEAAKFLISLANARGGKDNITCLIVQAPGANGTSVEMPAFGTPSLLSRINTVLPWPYIVLILGSLCALLALVLNAQKMPGAMPIFGVAAVMIVVGLIGLALANLRANAQADDSRDENANELRVYKGYTYEIGKELFERWTNQVDQMKSDLGDRAHTIDWPVYDKLSNEANAKLTKLHFLEAFRMKCQAFQMVASAFNQDRQREESFRPNFD